jgi:quercetin dioxygenase-like cupin family protein
LHHAGAAQMRAGTRGSIEEAEIEHNAHLPRVTEGVSRTGLHPAADGDSVKVDRISYRAGAHTHWHLHTGEQVLYGEDGHGWVKFDGRRRDTIGPGDVVYVPVGSRHWHGATPDSEFVHLAVTAGGDTVWLGEVSAEEYLSD